MRRGSYPPLLINDMKQAKAAAEEDDMMAGDWNRESEFSFRNKYIRKGSQNRVTVH